MTDEDGFRIEAAEQFGFSQTKDDGPYTCTEAQLIAFAKACERKGRAAIWSRTMVCSNHLTPSCTVDEYNQIAAFRGLPEMTIDVLERGLESEA